MNPLHPLEDARNKGACDVLTGKVFFYCVYVTDGESRFTSADEAKQEQLLQQFCAYLQTQAAAEGVSLTTGLETLRVTLPAPILDRNDELWQKAFARSSGLGSSSEIIPALRARHPGYKPAILFLLNRPGRSYAHFCNTPDRDAMEYCVLYQPDLRAIVHETLHLFGAVDFYHPEAMKAAAEQHLGHSVMMNISVEIDDATKYLIGWHKAPSPTAESFFRATAHISKSFMSQSQSRQNSHRNGFGTDTGDGYTYTGDHKDGLRSGMGSVKYSDGSSYLGMFSGGEKSGLGRYVWPNGDVYEGELSDGTLNGYGTLRRAGGTVERGIFKDGALVKKV